jgi:hypothetical protein
MPFSAAAAAGFFGADFTLRRLCLLADVGFLSRVPAKLAGCAFGGLQGIDFLRLLSRPGFCHVGGHGAFSASPFNDGFREDKAVFAGRKFFGFLASAALFNDLMAGASVELASVLAHEETLHTLLYACANHGYHILSVCIIKKNKLLCLKT